MRGRLTSGLMIGATLLLAGCGGKEVPEEGASNTGGEVLEGTASDAMLPLATVTSQPPLAPAEPDPRSPGPATSPSPTSTPASDAGSAVSNDEAATD